MSVHYMDVQQTLTLISANFAFILLLLLLSLLQHMLVLVFPSGFFLKYC